MNNYKINTVFNSLVNVLSTTAEEMKQQIEADFTPEEIQEEFGEIEYGDQHDIRSYVLYEDSNENHILVTTGVTEEEYNEDESTLPDANSILMKLMEEEGPFVDVMLELINNENRIVFLYQWHDSDIDCIVVEDKELYKQIKNNNYFNIVGYIEEYICEVANNAETKFNIARIIDKVYQKY